MSDSALKELREKALDVIKKQTGQISDSASRLPIYSDLEELISPGFLTHAVTISGVNLVMRSLFPSDFILLRHRLGRVRADRAWREWCIASSIWMIDGQILLEDPNATVIIRQHLNNMPMSGIETLFSIYTNLNNRVRAALQRLEAYCYEDVSRATWRTMGRGIPARNENIGIPGISSLGMNLAQRLWVAYNMSEDDRENWQQEWGIAKLIASASAPKGIKKLNMREESERTLEHERRVGVIHKTYFEATGIHLQENKDGLVVYRSVSPEELVQEMDRWVRGEKDVHDEIVDAYKDSIRAKREADRQRHEKRMQEVETLQVEREEQNLPSVVGYTAEQLQKLRAEKGLAPSRTGAIISNASYSGRLYEKYLARDIKTGALTDQGHSVPINSTSQTLDETLATRQVVLRDEES